MEQSIKEITELFIRTDVTQFRAYIDDKLSQKEPLLAEKFIVAAIFDLFKQTEQLVEMMLTEINIKYHPNMVNIYKCLLFETVKQNDLKMINHFLSLQKKLSVTNNDILESMIYSGNLVITKELITHLAQRGEKNLTEALSHAIKVKNDTMVIQLLELVSELTLTADLEQCFTVALHNDNFGAVAILFDSMPKPLSPVLMDEIAKSENKVLTNYLHKHLRIGK